MTLTTPPPASRDWAYYLDFDGTLVEIAETPEGVVVPPALLDLLGRLRDAASGAVAVITGRSLATLDRLLDPLKVNAAGQHGVEFRDTSGTGIHADPEAETALATIRRSFAAFATQDPHLLVEDKGLSVALHFRRAPAYGPAAETLAGRLAATCGGAIRMLAGKSVFEFRAAGADKGDAVRRFQAAPPFAGRVPVMIGDDVTDEDGFEAVNRLGGISIRVGRRPGSRAAYALDDVNAVYMWLAAAC